MVKHRIGVPYGHVKKNCEDTIRTLFDPPPPLPLPAGLEIGDGRFEAKLVKYCMIMAHIIALTVYAIPIVSAGLSPQCGLIGAIVPASVCCSSLTAIPLMTVIFVSLLLWIGMEGEISSRQLRCILLMCALSVVNFLNHFLPHHL